MTGRHYYASDCIGISVENTNSEDLGKIEDMVVSPEGNVDFLILSFGGIFGTSLNSKLLAIPYKRFDWNDQKQCLVLNMSKDAMERAPSFDKDELPELGGSYYSDATRYHQSVSGSLAKGSYAA